MSRREGRETQSIPSAALMISHVALPSLSAGAVPHSGAAGQDALSGASVQGAPDAGDAVAHLSLRRK